MPQCRRRAWAATAEKKLIGMASVVTFYRFVVISEPDALRLTITSLCEQHGLVGTALIASEGLNATLAATARSDLEAFIVELGKDVRFKDLNCKWSSSTGDNAVFDRLKVRTRPEIVSFGKEYQTSCAPGPRVVAEEWNALIESPDVTVIDARNTYETEIGKFPNAVIPGTKSFRDFPDFVDRELDPSTHSKLALYCTGGIRCEKAVQFLNGRGFEHIYQLDGGILNYLANVDAAHNRWSGQCFVFDQRVALDSHLRQGSYDQCHACRRPISASDKRSKHYRFGVSCARCIDETSPEQKDGFRERERQEELARNRGRRHVGASQRVATKLLSDSSEHRSKH